MPSKKDPGDINTGSGAFVSDPIISLPGLDAHVTSTSGAHPATAITTDDEPPILGVDNVEDALDSLSALVPPLPPKTGEFKTYLTFTGIPDWGVLKLDDGDVNAKLSLGVSDLLIDEGNFYYYRTPTPTGDDPPFTVRGEDPAVDTVFNVEDTFALSYGGGGKGVTRSGGFTRGGDLIQSMRLAPANLAGNYAVLSGQLYPADRGVLTLIKWPAGGDLAAFLAQPLKTRCVAALLLGGGLSAPGGDGQPGGIFTGDKSDPFSYPGLASGQYSIAELHTGLSDIDASALPAPFDVGDNTAGQVRLGTNPLAGPVVTDGINILGGSTAARGGGHDQNFFRYRLPYLDDYSDTTGLRYTPTDDKPRYFQKPALSLTPGVDLTQAGNFPDFPREYWLAQVARYRHRFAFGPGGAGPTLDDGTFILLHFKKEQYFEGFVRDGVVPTDDMLYSANLVDWVDPENPENIVTDDPANGFPAAPSYHVMRAAIFEDDDGTAALTPGASSYTYTRTVDAYVQISGIKYFYPANSGGSLWSISSATATAAGYFQSTYRTNEPAQTGDILLGNQNPMVMQLAAFSYSEISGTPTFTTTGLTSASDSIRRQRLELFLADLGFGIGSPPSTVDDAAFTSATITLTGDLEEPAFSVDAILKAWYRRPLLTIPNSASPSDGIVVAASDTKKVLFHSTLNDSPVYGNFNAAGTTGPVKATLETALKDVQERFLDEVYRYRGDFFGYPNAANLIGPGLPLGSIADTDVVARIGTFGTYPAASWMQSGYHTMDLTAGAVATSAQVAGLPESAPTLADAITYSPMPSAGLLQYPQVDYSSGYRPSFVDGDITAGAQFTYAGATGDRTYFRTFDTSFGGTVASAGQTQVRLRIIGVQLSDFAYSAPGPGGVGLAILIKVPGLTSWMDLGRAHGSGPSKQDLALDGAGCQVAGANTFDSTDDAFTGISLEGKDTGLVYCEVEANVGPTATFFTNVSSEVPLLVKVIIKDNATGRALNWGFAGSAPVFLRGITRIELIPIA